MINAALIIAETIISFLLLLILFKKYKIDGIYIFAILAISISCIMNLKTISIMNIGIPLGFGVTTSIILGANLITQKNGQEEIKNYILLIFISGLITLLFLNLSGMMSSSEYNYLANKSYDNIFTYNIRIYIALFLSIIISIWLSSNLFYTIKRLKNKIILSNIFSIIITEFFENIIFVLIAYLFDYNGIDIILCIVFRYVIKVLIGIVGTLPLYIASKYN